jgi:hypothetical protein
MSAAQAVVTRGASRSRRQHDRDGNGEPHDRSGGQEIKVRTLKPPHASRHDRNYGHKAPSNGKEQLSLGRKPYPTSRVAGAFLEILLYRLTTIA